MSTSIIILILFFFALFLSVLVYGTVRVIKSLLAEKKYWKAATIILGSIAVAVMLSFFGYYLLEMEVYSTVFLFVIGMSVVLIIILLQDDMSKREKE